MKRILLVFALLLTPFTGCAETPKTDCCCVDCKCVDCQCDTDCNECCGPNCMASQRVAPVDDSNRAYLTIYGQANDKTFQTFCQWGRQTSGTHYTELSPGMPMAERMAGIETPRILITDSTGKTIYKGAPKSYAEFRFNFDRACPDGNCRPTPAPQPAPTPAPAPAPVIDVDVNPVPDSPADSGMPPWWLIVLVALGLGGVGYATWHRSEYFSS